MTFDKDARYRKSHEWVRQEGDVLVCGISDYAQDSLGDVVFVELPEKGKHLDAEQPFAVVESVKAASDIYMPVSGEIVEVNTGLEEKPELVNEAPFGDGWLVKFKPDDLAAVSSLMSSEEYEEYTKGLDE